MRRIALVHEAGTIPCIDPYTLSVTATIDVGANLELALGRAVKGGVCVHAATVRRLGSMRD